MTAKSGAQTAPQGSFLKKSYYGLVQGENFLGHFFLLIIRLYWGGLLIMTGFGKWLHGPNVADYFESLHIPLPLFTTYFVGTIEFLGGLSLVLGLFSRVFTILLAIVFFVAYSVAHKEALINFFVKPSVFISQDPFLYLFAALTVLCFGPGFISLDYWIERRVYGRGL